MAEEEGCWVRRSCVYVGARTYTLATGVPDPKSLFSPVDVLQNRVIRRVGTAASGHGINVATHKVYSGGNFQHLVEYLNEQRGV
jgi:hypothetical protein